jgi:cytochrome c oxidase assembly factor CtaG
MLQHLLLLVVVPALVLWSLPPRGRGLAWAGGGLGPVGGWVAGIGAMYLWHVPALCDAASASTAIHAVQAISLLAMGGAFWWPIFAPHAQDRISPWAGVGYLFTACLACSALGILLTLTPIEVCPIFRAPVDRFGLLPIIRGTWGISAARDRAVGGLLMWVPMCTIYGGAILLELSRWYHPESMGNTEAAR